MNRFLSWGRTARLSVLAGATLIVFVISSLQARSQDYPTRNITLVVPSPAGGGTDMQARILAPKLGELLGQAIIIENRPGASGNIGAQAVAKAPPDGYTLLAMISSHVINPFVLPSVPYEIDRDFALISRTITAPGVLVGHPSLPAQNLDELLRYLEANPGKVPFGSGGVGSLSHLIMERVEQDAGLKLLHVPYRGTGPALNDLLAGQVVLMIPDLTIALGQIRSGNLRAYGVTSASRATSIPELPTLSEAGLPGFDAVQWFGLAAPAGTPPAAIAKLHAAVVSALNDPVLRAQYESIAMQPDPSPSPEAFAKFVHEEASRWGSIVKSAHVTAE